MNNNYEEFTESQAKTLEKYVTSITSPIFVLRNLPEVIKGALFSRYSRSSLGLRTLLLKEFISNNDEASFEAIVGAEANSESPQQQTAAIKRAQNFYDRILDGYGDDSIGELGGAHLAIENISMLAAKAIEDSRIGGSPLEKSTRYIFFDQKVRGEYLYYREPILLTSAYRDIYIDTCNMLFETYSELIPPLTSILEKSFPRSQEISQVAYNAALRAKVLDGLRGLLPAGTLTNMGVFGNGRFFESLLHRLHSQNLAELQEIGRRSQEELTKVIPSFVRRADVAHRTHHGYQHFHNAMGAQLRLLAEQHCTFDSGETESRVRLIAHQPDDIYQVAAALLYAHSNKGLLELTQYCRQLPEEELARILDGACSARENRRHKSPRALEHAEFTFEILSDFGVYRDLHRHRMLTQERQLLTCDYGYYTPPEIIGTELEEPYHQSMNRAKEVFDVIAQELPEEAQYVVPMAFNVRWYFHINLRGLQWLCELRSGAAGHPNYRRIAQEMARQTIAAQPAYERFFKFVDFDGYEIGRLDQEQRNVDKAKRE